MKHEHDSILRVVFVNQLAFLNFLAEPTGNVGNTGICGIAVDVCLNTVLTDHHIPVGTSRSGPYDEVFLALAKDLTHCCHRLLIGCKTAEGDLIAALDILGNRIM